MAGSHSKFASDEKYLFCYSSGSGGVGKWANAPDRDLGFNYTQAGQENSFTWKAMAKGLEIQFPLIARLRDEGKVRVETMETSGRWFRSKYRLTPTTSFTVLKDLDGSDRRTIWFDSRFYRINLLWEGGTLRTADNVELPFQSVDVKGIESRFEGVRYRVNVEKGVCQKPGGSAVLRIRPRGNRIVVAMK